ncbi:MAG: hypothetical protein GWM90_22320, partial [Gemmatimonadetes bacterium]|nr:hypothetical protein [Gemmatimonadota bacterium]NIQ57346.1 hypothetical protein [Gemmatimonadota bacterium]NIU77509.1 hypothetical protein [Gammaproteobacteria bacterium]NIX46717.1 hypothetical protein [Gemmatimonadota bacterium]NIY11065.1 hypothetical protein [Gemmatimonadota bacterium]
MKPDASRILTLAALVPALALAGAGCGDVEETPDAAATDTAAAPDTTVTPPDTAAIRVEDAGLQTPESVLHDDRADVYLVSNINGAPTERDDNGFISRVGPDGTVLELRWIDGEA